ncbi:MULTISPECIES: 6-carboxytetrahydropterin synthase [unclassified Nocardia]|uniref:6-pyruvoyl trahydropterin synthase family protein n=1 Tax=unclassified Nocardia TaxID=2637762 RepID=UPI00278BEFC6|nr:MULTISPECIES: 6-carboxytetrahydropterin synthase [unclassified Nocardia]
MTTHITVTHHAEAAHRIPVLSGPGAKCRNIHGHSWHLEWTFDATGIGVEGIEFGAIKTVLRGWVDERMDHGFIGHAEDQWTKLLAADGLKVLRLPTWPTTEAIAEHLAQVTETLLPDLRLVSVLVREGHGNTAVYSPDHAPASAPDITSPTTARRTLTGRF